MRKKTKNKWAGLLLSMGLFCSTMGTGLLAKGGTPYTDVDENAWYMEPVRDMYEKKIMTGTTDTTFEPDKNLTRGMVATILYRLEGSPKKYLEKFSDVPGSSYYADSSAWANSRGLMTGNEHAGNKNTFDGETPIKREDLALVLQRYNVFKKRSAGTEKELTSFKDADQVSGYAKIGMIWATGNGIITGKENGTLLDPLGPTSRAEAAAMFSRYLQGTGNSTVTPDPDEGLWINPSNLGELTELEMDGKELAFYSLPDDFDRMISGTLADPTVKLFTYQIRDAKDILIKSGTITPQENWNVSPIGFMSGMNTFSVKAEYADGKVLEDSINVISSDRDLYQYLDLDLEDPDGDGLPNYHEEYFGTDPDKADTDGDGIDDYHEIYWFNGYDPLDAKSVDGKTLDGDLDYDGDGLINRYELNVSKTDPTVADTDGDGLNDKEEETLKTDPNNKDTDGDGAWDGWEVENGYDPLTFNSSFNVKMEKKSENSGVNASVALDVPGDVTQSVQVYEINPQTDLNLNDQIAGYMGSAYEFQAGGKFDQATISFSYDPAEFANEEEFEPRIYYYNEETGFLEELPNQVVENGKVSATTSHFSIYILLNRTKFNKIWEQDFELNEDSNFEDGLPYYVSFVVDHSPSMGWNDPEYVRLEVAKAFINKMNFTRNPSDMASVVQFATKAEIMVELTEDKDMLVNTIDLITNTENGCGATNNNTNGSAGIYTGLETFRQKNMDVNANRFMIFLTDGEDNEFSYDYEDLISEANDMGVTIFTIGMDSADEDLLTHIAESTGGKYYQASKVQGEDISQSLPEIFEWIENETITSMDDLNQDGIPDQIAELIKQGKIVSATGSLSLAGHDLTYKDGILCNDIDGDGLLNGEEIEILHVENGSQDEEGNPGISVTYKYLSSPVLPDTDGDGYRDDYDPEPLNWNVGDRDLLFFSNLTYNTTSTMNGNVTGYNPNDFENSDWRIFDYGTLSELGNQWTIEKAVVNDSFLGGYEATVYKNGNNIVLANTGTNDLYGWISNLLGYGRYHFHPEEINAFLFALSVYNEFVAGNPEVNFYITGHSLGGYLTQIQVSEFTMLGWNDSIKKAVYFNGIGMDWMPNPLEEYILQELDLRVRALKQYSEYQSQGKSNGRLVSHYIRGDVVSALGIHYGNLVPHSPTNEMIEKHYNDTHWNTTASNSFTDAIADFLEIFQDVAITAATLLLNVNTRSYFDEYKSGNFIDYFLFAHKMDAMFSTIDQGERY